MNKLKTKTDSEKISKDDLNFNTEMPNVDLDIATSKVVMKLEIEPIKHNILTRKDTFDQYDSS